MKPVIRSNQGRRRAPTALFGAVALGLLAAGTMWAIAPAKSGAPTLTASGPLNDMAPRESRVFVSADEAPWRRARAAAPNDEDEATTRGAHVAAPKSIPPVDMPDVAHPPRWTRVLAAPSPPSPPDPAVPPPMAVDPEGH